MNMKPTAFPHGACRLFSTLLTLAFLAGAEWSPGQATSGQWNEGAGKEIKNNQGVHLGFVKDMVVDLENGRYVGMLVSFGGVLGLGEKSVIIPPAALRDNGTPRTLFLNMDEKTFRNAPTFEVSKKVGPPQSAKVEEVYRYFGQTPFFATPNGPSTLNGEKLVPLGFIQKIAQILYLPVENLQGVPVGYVTGLRGLDPVTNRIKGVVIGPYGNIVQGKMKIVPPQALRYNLKHNALRINDHEQEFKDSPAFEISQGGKFHEEDPSSRPGVHPPPLAHGEDAKDKAITLKIWKRISADRNLSVYGKNIEVATANGKVTIRGRATSAANRDRLLSYATEAAGPGNVTDLIEVRPMSEAEKAIDR